MTQLKTMYPGVANSPDTFLVEGLTIDGTVMYVADGAVFGEIPTLAVIGQAELAETVQITGKQSDGGYTIIRGVEGKRKAWAKATNVARNWTNKDYETLRANITAINDGKVDKIDGKGLSTHDYDDNAKGKVDEIPPDPKYTDTVPDLTPYAKASDLSTEREERKADIAKVRSDHTTDIQSVRTAHSANIQSVRADYAKDIKTAKDALTVDINNVKAAHDADIKRLGSEKLNKTDIINDLTTGGTDKALSAEQGKTLFMYADNGKKSIADAIVGKGVDATKSDDFNTLADKISKIKTGYGVGEEVPVEEIKTFHPYENESDYEVSCIKLVVKKSGNDTIEPGDPTSLAVDTNRRVRVGTSNGVLYTFNEFFQYDCIVYGYKSIIALSTDPSSYVYRAHERSTSITRSVTGAVGHEGETVNYRMVIDIGQGPVRAITSKYYYLYCGAGNKVVEVTNGLRKSWEFTGHTAQVNAVAVDKHETKVKDWNIYSGGADNKVFKISTDGKKIWEFTLHTAAVNALAVDDDGYVYSGGADCTIYKISSDGKKVWERKTNNAITAIAIAPEGGVMVGTTGSTFYTFEADGTPREKEEMTYKDENGKAIPDGDVVDIVVANDASIFMVTKKEKVIYKLKYGAYKKSYKILK